MRRREFITLFGVAMAARPLAARAQQPNRMRLVGVLMAFAETDSAAQSWLAAFRAALANSGWTEGSNLRIELRWSANILFLSGSAAQKSWSIYGPAPGGENFSLCQGDFVDRRCCGDRGSHRGWFGTIALTWVRPERPSS